MNCNNYEPLAVIFVRYFASRSRKNRRSRRSTPDEGQEARVNKPIGVRAAASPFGTRKHAGYVRDPGHAVYHRGDRRINYGDRTSTGR